MIRTTEQISTGITIAQWTISSRTFLEYGCTVEMRKDIVRRDTGRTAFKYNQPVSWTEMGVCIAAVDADHFASGLILSDDLRGQYTTLDGLYTHTTSFLHIGPPRTPSSLAPYSSSGPPSAVPFAFSPPVLHKQEVSLMADLQAIRFEGDEVKHLKEVIEVKSFISYAVPTYRYVLENRSFFSHNLFETNNDKFQVSHRWLEDPSGTAIKTLFQTRPFGYYREGFSTQDTSPTGQLGRYQFSVDTVSGLKQAFRGAIARARDRGDPTWAAQGIIGVQRDNGVNESMKIGMEYMLGKRRGAGPPPKWLTVRAPKPNRWKSPMSADQRDEMNEIEMILAERQRAKLSSSSAKRTAKKTAKTRTVPPRTSAVPPRSPDPQHTAPAAKLNTNKDLAPHPQPASIAPTPVKPNYDPIPDPKGYYKVLGISTPDIQYIHDRQSAAWDRIIQQRYRKQSADNHPDLFPDPEDKKRQLVVQIELNAAREALETLSLRQAYK